MNELSKLTKVNDSFTVNRYENGFMVEVTGRDKKDDWKTIKIVCNTEDEVFQLIKQYNLMDLE